MFDGIQDILSEVRRRTDELEQTIKGQVSQLREQAKPVVDRLRELEAESSRLSKQLQSYNQTFNEKKEEYMSGLRDQKNLIDRQIKTTSVKDSNVIQLETESEKLDKKISDAGTLTLVPQTRGLGDGYGRHLK